MILKRLSLRNFRQFRDTEIEFAPGVTAIVGANGSGKTTIIEAIVWCLYGEQRNTKETLRPFGAEEKSPTSVVLEFTIANQQWVVERSLTTASLTLVNTNSRIASSLREVTKAVTELLCLNYEQFRNSFCTEQKDLTFLRFSTPGRQQEELARMLGYDRIRAASKAAKEKAKSLSDTVKGMEETLRSQAALGDAVQRAREELSKAEQDEMSARDKLFEAQKRAEGAKEQLENAKSAIELIVKMQAQGELLKALKKQMEDVKERVEKLSAEVKRRDELREIAQQHEEAQHRYSELMRMTKAVDQRKTIEAEIAAAKERLAKLNAYVDSLRAKGIDDDSYVEAERTARETAEAARRALEQLHDRRIKAESELERAKTLYEQLRQARKELETSIASGKCPTCGQKWPEERISELKSRKEAEAAALADVTRLEKSLGEVMSHTSEVKSAEDAAEHAKKRLEEVNIARAELRHRVEERVELENTIRSNQSCLDELPQPPNPAEIEKCERIIAETKAAAREFDSLSRADEELSKFENEYQSVKSSFERKQQEQSASEVLLRELGYEISDKSKAEQDRDAALQLIQHAKEREVEHRNAKKWLDDKRNALAASEVAYENYRRQKNRAEEMEQQAKLYNETSAALADFREALNQRTRPLLEQLASNNLAELSGGRYTQLKLNNKYEPTIIDEDIEKQVISGGEEDIVALSLRLALAQMIQERSGQPMSLLILDEVFGSLDTERRANVLSQLNAMRDMFEQVILISHIEAINEAADRCLMVSYDQASRESTVREALAEVLPPV